MIVPGAVVIPSGMMLLFPPDPPLPSIGAPNWPLKPACPDDDLRWLERLSTNLALPFRALAAWRSAWLSACAIASCASPLAKTAITVDRATVSTAKWRYILLETGRVRAMPLMVAMQIAL